MAHLFQKLNYLVKIMRFYFILIAILSIISCEENQDEPTPTETTESTGPTDTVGIIKGTVIYGDKRVRGAKILIDNKIYLTRNDGVFCFKDISPNEYDIVVNHFQYESYTSKINVKAGEIINHSVSLQPRSPILSLAGDIENLDFGLTTNSLSFIIENVGIGTLEWQLVFEEESWFTVNVSEGTGGAEIIVTLNRGGLLEGTYESEIIVKNEAFDEDADTIDIHVTSENKLVSFKPGADEGKDAYAIFNDNYTSELKPEIPYSPVLGVFQWTISSVFSPSVAVIEFTELKSLTNIDVLKA